MKRYWSHYTSEAFANLERDKLVAVLPIGAIEQHGPHLPMSVDAAVADAMVEEIIKRLPETSRAIFLPTQAICKSNEHSRYPGSLTLSSQTLMQVWCEIGACVAAAGIRKLVFLNSHGGNITIMDTVTRELRIRHNMMAFSVNWWGQGMPENTYTEEEMRFGIHAGDMETSVMLALYPELVDMSKAQNFRSSLQDLTQEFRHISLGAGAKPGWQAQDINPYGAAGNATLATAEKGRATIDYAAEKLVELLDEVERVPLTWLDNQPAW